MFIWEVEMIYSGSQTRLRVLSETVSHSNSKISQGRRYKAFLVILRWLEEHWRTDELDCGELCSEKLARANCMLALCVTLSSTDQNKAK